MIHRQHEVKALEVRHPHLARPQRGQVIPPLQRVALAARIGRAPEVIVVGARGVEFDPLRETRGKQLGAQHALRRR
ncbi:hypothetical protein D3C71_1743690 [compost metagenome]